MLDLPIFLLSAVSEFCPADACIQRVDKHRFKIQSRNAATLSRFTNRQPLELVLSDPLVTSFQWAIALHDQKALSTFAENIRKQVAHQLNGFEGDTVVLIQLA
jgi:hypothetical protein